MSLSWGWSCDLGSDIDGFGLGVYDPGLAVCNLGQVLHDSGMDVCVSGLDVWWGLSGSG